MLPLDTVTDTGRVPYGFACPVSVPSLNEIEVDGVVDEDDAGAAAPKLPDGAAAALVPVTLAAEGTACAPGSV